MTNESFEQELSADTFFQRLSATEKNILEVDIFNGDTPVESLGKIADLEKGRGVMGRLRQYLELKESGASKEVLKAEAKDIEELICNAIE